jgi:hypothetical protein
MTGFVLLFCGIGFATPIVVALRTCVGHPWWVWVTGMVVGLAMGTLNVAIWRKIILICDHKSVSGEESKPDTIKVNLLFGVGLFGMVITVAMTSELMAILVG